MRHDLEDEVFEETMEIEEFHLNKIKSRIKVKVKNYKAFNKYRSETILGF